MTGQTHATAVASSDSHAVARSCTQVADEESGSGRVASFIQMLQGIRLCTAGNVAKCILYAHCTVWSRLHACAHSRISLCLCVCVSLSLCLSDAQHLHESLSRRAATVV